VVFLRERKTPVAIKPIVRRIAEMPRAKIAQRHSVVEAESAAG